MFCRAKSQAFYPGDRLHVKSNRSVGPASMFCVAGNPADIDLSRNEQFPSRPVTARSTGRWPKDSGSWRKPRSDGLIAKMQPLLVFAAVGVAVIQDVQTLQRQLLTFLVDRLQVANSQQRIGQDPPVGIIVAGSNPRNSMMRRRWDSVGRFWFFSHFSTAESVIPMPNISDSLRCDKPRSTRF